MFSEEDTVSSWLSQEPDLRSVLRTHAGLVWWGDREDSPPCFEDPLRGRLLGYSELTPCWPKKALASLHLPDEVMETRPCGSVSDGTGTAVSSCVHTATLCELGWTSRGRDSKLG